MRDQSVTTGRAAEILGLTAREFDRLCRRGDIPQPPLLGSRRRWAQADLSRARAAMSALAVPCCGCAAPTASATGRCVACRDARAR